MNAVLPLLALLSLAAAPSTHAPKHAPKHGSHHAPRSLERARINDNRRPAGTLRAGVLTLRLEARVATWHPDADDGPGVDVQAFAEQGRAAEIPGPLVRVPAGTVVDLTLHDAVPGSGVLVVHGLSSRLARGGGTGGGTGGGAADADSIRLSSGETARRRFRLDAPGTYYYWGTTTGRRFGVRLHEDAQLTGAIVVDEAPKAGAAAPRRDDRVFVIGMMGDTTGAANPGRLREHLLFVINGRSWPHTERLSYALGDTIVWRVLNTTVDPHPMHLHGAYFRVDSRGNGTSDTTYAPDRRDVANTEFMLPGATMTMTWSPVHDGNWLLHCHIPEHFGPRGPLGTLRPPAEAHDRAPGAIAHAMTNHATQEMSGLVMAVTIRPRPDDVGAPATTVADRGRRRIRLLVRANPASTAAAPFYGVALHERGAEPAADSGGPHAGAPIVLVRGQPVSMVVVNRLAAPTSVHWHGIELESYNDGVAGLSGSGTHLAPVIAPGDSFEARFTPPRAGTFMYHTHVDELHQQRAGLAGILLVLEPDEVYDPATDIAILVSTPGDAAAEQRTVLINGSLTPPPLELRRGVHYRLRLANITASRPGMRVELRRDSLLATWTPLAKDGADLPPARRVPRPARQPLSIGETADFEVTPTSAGTSRLEMLTATGALLATVEMIVR